MQRSAGRAKTGKLSTPKATGRCVCGDVKFEIAYPAFWAWHDHSDASRRAQGCAYATYVGTWRSRFRVWEGESNPPVSRGYSALHLVQPIPYHHCYHFRRPLGRTGEPATTSGASVNDCWWTLDQRLDQSLQLRLRQRRDRKCGARRHILGVENIEHRIPP
jgi:hypothetical protein